jgi:putative phosphoesterase
MKIGLISDVHGALDNLTAALTTLRNVPVDCILCAGDLVDYGDYPKDVVRRIIADEIPCVQGNHDRTAAARNYRLRSHQTRQQSQVLGMGTLQWLQQLPITRRFEWHDTRLLLAHSTPAGDDMYIHANSSPHLLRRIVQDAAPADVIVLGHTHEPMWLAFDGVTIINPGSVYRNYSMDVNTCGVLSLPERDFTLLNIETGRMVPLEKTDVPAPQS